jgi:hypothetical protein
MAKLTPSRMVVFATLAAIAVGLATPAFAVPYDRSGAERGDFVYVPVDSGCNGNRASCDLARY